MEPVTDHATDILLVAEARNGDQCAMETLLAQYKPLLASVANRLRHQAMGALNGDDVNQEAAKIFIELVREYDAPSASSFGVYLKQKLKWRLMNYLRRERRKRGRQEILADDLLASLAEETSPAVGFDVNNPRIRAALRRLSPKQRSVIFRLYWQGQSVEEIAAELSVTSQSVTALRRRAEERIKEVVERRSRPCGALIPSRPDPLV